MQAAFWLFLAAGLSDAVDGYVAKRFNSRTTLGAYLDPLADKTLLDGTYLALAWAGWLPVWLVALVLCRDVLIVIGVILIRRRHPSYRIRPLVEARSIRSARSSWWPACWRMLVVWSTSGASSPP